MKYCIWRSWDTHGACLVAYLPHHADSQYRYIWGALLNIHLPLRRLSRMKCRHVSISPATLYPLLYHHKVPSYSTTSSVS